MPPQQPSNQPNFDFIMNPSQQQGKKSLLPAGNSTGQRLMIVVGAAGVLLVFLLLFMLILGSGGDNKQNLLKAAQEQTELARVAALASDSTDQTLQNFAVNTGLTAASDQQKLFTTLADNGIVFDDKELALGQNPDTDTALETAKAAANFDAVLRATLTEQLEQHQATLQEAFDKSGNAEIKDRLQQAYANTDALLKQLNPETTTTE